MKIAVILGTRPEIIKMAPILKCLRTRKLDFFTLHTGQHYSYELDRVFFEQLELPLPDYNLEAGSGTHAEETARMLTGIEKVLTARRPDIVLVEGDTNSVLAGALAAVKLGIAVGHVEAGLRSYDRRMPEEINRIITDHIAELLFAPTPKAQETLLVEGINRKKIFVTGNTIVDAVYQNLELARRRVDIGTRFGLLAGRYFLVTLHRQENTVDPSRFKAIIDGLESLAEKSGLPVVYPAHPRSRRLLANLERKPGKITIIDPVDYFSFLQLESNAKLVLTDSGGVQEEACICLLYTS
ncbi:MAG: UDP-N-acetylglucosamine 2-epimerase (non-hydrolyzing), partial [Dehalococcoidales bacterium]|nr:UDP-N-acetylglucosamine 2-epimerase (non-hydrolyzing) [Dehalococcoidales bacterium]